MLLLLYTEVYSFSELFILFQNYLLTSHQDNKGKNEHSIYRLTSLKGPRASLQTQQTTSCISCHLVCDCFLLTDGKTINRTSFLFFGLMKQVRGIGRMRLHLSPFKPKPFQMLSLPALKCSNSYPLPPRMWHEILKQ